MTFNANIQAESVAFSTDTSICDYARDDYLITLFYVFVDPNSI